MGLSPWPYFSVCVFLLLHFFAAKNGQILQQELQNVKQNVNKRKQIKKQLKKQKMPSVEAAKVVTKAKNIYNKILPPFQKKNKILFPFKKKQSNEKGIYIFLPLFFFVIFFVHTYEDKKKYFHAHNENSIKMLDFLLPINLYIIISDYDVEEKRTENVSKEIGFDGFLLVLLFSSFYVIPVHPSTHL